MVFLYALFVFIPNLIIFGNIWHTEKRKKKLSLNVAVRHFGQQTMRRRDSLSMIEGKTCGADIS